MNLFHTKKKFLKAVAAGDAKTVAAYLAVSTSWARTQDEKTKDYALHSAIRGGHTDIVRQLLKAGATLWYGGNESQTPLHAAVMSGNLAIVKILLETPDNNFDAKDVNGLSPLHYAIRDNKTEILKAFLETRKADLNASDRPALYYAVECGQTDCVKLLLAAGADPSVRRTVTSYEYDDDDDYYYSHRREPRKTTVTYFSPLNCACTNNHTEIAGELLKAGARWMSMEFPLHAAAAHGNVPLMTLLIQNGFNPKQLDQTQETLLHKVAKSRNRESLSEAVLFVLAQGVDKNALDKDNRTALSYVQQFALTDIVKILQDPLPAQLLAPVKPVIQPVVEMPPPAAAVAPAPIPLQETETWTMAGANSIVHMTLYPGLGRRLTEIFNFESRERIAITENFTLKTETMGPHENFDNIGDEALRKAFDEFRRLGGKADESAVLGNRLMKMKMKPG